MATSKINAIILAGTHNQKKKLIDEYDGQGPKNKGLVTQITGKPLILGVLDCLRNSDYISLHIPLDKKVGATITKKEFDVMKKGVVVINCARGGVVSEKDLLDALKSGKVARAAMDVFETEPPTPEEYELIKHPNVSITPHIGASTVEAQERVGEEIAKKVVEALK